MEQVRENSSRISCSSQQRPVPTVKNAKRPFAAVNIRYPLTDAEDQTALSEKYVIKSVPTLVINASVITGVGSIIGWIKSGKANVD